jgi:hypothetical protein
VFSDVVDGTQAGQCRVDRSDDLLGPGGTLPQRS